MRRSSLGVILLIAIVQVAAAETLDEQFDALVNEFKNGPKSGPSLLPYWRQNFTLDPGTLASVEGNEFLWKQVANNKPAQKDHSEYDSMLLKTPDEAMIRQATALACLAHTTSPIPNERNVQELRLLLSESKVYQPWRAGLVLSRTKNNDIYKELKRIIERVPHDAQESSERMLALPRQGPYHANRVSMYVIAVRGWAFAASAKALAQLGDPGGAKLLNEALILLQQETPGLDDYSVQGIHAALIELANAGEKQKEAVLKEVHELLKRPWPAASADAKLSILADAVGILQGIKKLISSSDLVTTTFVESELTPKAYEYLLELVDKNEVSPTPDLLKALEQKAGRVSALKENQKQREIMLNKAIQDIDVQKVLLEDTDFTQSLSPHNAFQNSEGRSFLFAQLQEYSKRLDDGPHLANRIESVLKRAGSQAVILRYLECSNFMHNNDVISTPFSNDQVAVIINLLQKSQIYEPWRAAPILARSSAWPELKKLFVESSDKTRMAKALADSSNPEAAKLLRELIESTAATPKVESVQIAFWTLAASRNAEAVAALLNEANVLLSSAETDTKIKAEFRKTALEALHVVISNFDEKLVTRSLEILSYCKPTPDEFKKVIDPAIESSLSVSHSNQLDQAKRSIQSSSSKKD